MAKWYLFSMLSLFLASWIVSVQSVAPISLPLHTDSRWIFNKQGHRVKLACVNWPSHLEPVVAEGLNRHPMDAIVRHVKVMGFNCVRFTWPLELAINETLASMTVKQSFLSLGLTDALAGITANNPWIVNLSLIRAYEAVLQVFRRNLMMVVLDNHLTVPGWCCSNDDGNGFFGDTYFDPQDWMEGLNRMATMARKFPNVVGMSLRNELRGPKSNEDDWYRYMQQGAETVHAANPHVLVILSGLSFDTNLTFLRNRPVNVSFTDKLVFEFHWYSFSDGNAWETGNPNEVCGRISKNKMDAAGFLTEQGFPLFVSEFGVDETGTNLGDNRYLSCFMAMAADQDWDFAVWALQGSYYLRQGEVNSGETYGLLDDNWSGLRNRTILARLSVLQTPFRGPGWEQTTLHQVLFHPLTGLCVDKRRHVEPLRLAPCHSAAQWWNYTAANGTLQVTGTNFVLQVYRQNRPVTLALSPPRNATRWDIISNSRLHFATNTTNGQLCLDVSRRGVIVSYQCKCLSSDTTCEPASQWFKLINTTRV